MKNLKKSMVALMILLGMGLSGNIYAAEPKVSGTASVDVMSNYVWRGQKLTNSWVIQPSVGITHGNFCANIWANYDSDSKIDEGDGHGELSETDLTLSYSFSVEKWNSVQGMSIMLLPEQMIRRRFTFPRHTAHY